jgi:hypothetical protein
MNIINVSALKSLATNKKLLDRAMIFIGLDAAFVAGYYVAIRQLNAQYDERLSAEIAATKKYYGTHLVSHKEYESPEDAVEALIEADEDPEKSIAKYHSAKIAREEGYIVEPSEPDGVVEISKNVFTDSKYLDLDIDAEERSPDRPYVISFDEFYESANTSQALTYYQGDEVLVDEANKHIPDVDLIVGEDNLERFGHGSKDPRVVFIRNENLEIDFEVTLADGKYSEEVLGFKHEDKPSLRRFRETDD